MVEELKKTKDQFLDHLEGLIAERGIARLDVKLLGEYADIIKDLAEAEALAIPRAALMMPRTDGMKITGSTSQRRAASTLPT